MTAPNRRAYVWYIGDLGYISIVGPLRRYFWYCDTSPVALLNGLYRVLARVPLAMPLVLPPGVID